MLDPRRTGIAWDARDPIGRYLEFALDAPVILAPKGSRYPTFRQLLEEDSATKEMWDVHLSTLFPEIRPREYFEIRSIDAMEPAHLSAAVALVCGVVYAKNSALAAMELLGDPDPDLLVRAGQAGLDDPRICARSTTLVQLAIEGCHALGPAYIGQSDIQTAEKFFADRGLLG
jgi:glutamate--cysteine ligase